MNYFDPKEFACHCGCGLKEVDPGLLRWLNVIRHYAGKPMIINSGVRCEDYNLHVGGSPKSRHLPNEKGQGEAADIRIPGMDLVELYERCIMHGAFGGVGLYPHQGFVHVDMRLPHSERARWIQLKTPDNVLVVIPFNVTALTDVRC